MVIKLIRSADAASIIYKVRSLKHMEIFIQPDMTHDPQLRKSALLKERWCLIQSGVERKFIKICYNSIFAPGMVN